MRLFDGSAEYVRADEITTGAIVRCIDGEWREIVAVERDGQMVTFVCGDGYGWSAPMTSRELRKVKL